MTSQDLTGNEFVEVPVAAGHKLKTGAIGMVAVLFMATANAAPIVTGRPVMTRPSSVASAAAINSFSSSRQATSGIGTRWRRRNRPISPSTPPFSGAPVLPGMQKN